MSINGTTKSLNPQCQIIWYKWTNETVSLASSTPTSDSSAASGFDISNHLVEGCSFSKNMTNPGGNFSFRLDSSREWKDDIKPGQWCLIFMSNTGNLTLPERESATDLPPSPADLTSVKGNLRAICYIERVAVVGNVDDKGATDVVYEISGRDYGVVYEETDLWYNFFKFEQIKVDSLTAQLQRSQDDGAHALVELTHQLFFAADSILSTEALGPSNSLTSIGQQWILPKPMLQALGITTGGKASFYGNIDNLLQLQITNCSFMLQNPLQFLNGSAWAKLKQFSIPELHELFPELDNSGNPTLTFRPIPFSIDQSAYPKLAENIDRFLDLTSDPTRNVSVLEQDLMNFNLGEDNHARYNHFLTQVQSALNVVETNIAILQNRSSIAGRSYPYMNQLSLMRHGFRPMHILINALPEKLVNKAATDKDGFPVPDLLLQYNEVLYDYWNNAVSFESGTAVIDGTTDVRIGKTVTFDEEISHIGNKAFYIEGYTDEFLIDGNGASSWTQTLQMTRGADLDLLKAATSGFNSRTDKSKDHLRLGEFTKKR